MAYHNFPMDILAVSEISYDVGCCLCPEEASTRTLLKSDKELPH